MARTVFINRLHASLAADRTDPDAARGHQAARPAGAVGMARRRPVSVGQHLREASVLCGGTAFSAVLTSHRPCLDCNRRLYLCLLCFNRVTELFPFALVFRRILVILSVYDGNSYWCTYNSSSCFLKLTISYKVYSVDGSRTLQSSYCASSCSAAFARRPRTTAPCPIGSARAGASSGCATVVHTSCPQFKGGISIVENIRNL